MLQLEDIADVIAGAVREATTPLIERCAALEVGNTAMAGRIAELEARELPIDSGAVERIKASLAELKASLPAVVAQCDFTKAEVQPLFARIDALEQRELLLPEKGEPGEPGMPGEVDMDAIEVWLGARVAEAIAEIPLPQDGKSVDMAEVKQLVDQAVAEIPPAKDGADCDMAAVKAMIAEEVVVAVSTIPPAEKGEPGRDVDMAEVGTRIETAVRTAVEAIPAPKDGEPGKDGLGLADALRDAEGNLVLVMTDGRTKSLGPVNGKDGKDGADGHTFTLNDFDIIQIDERTDKWCFTHGDVMHSFERAIPAVIYRGVWREGDVYQRGDMATWGGSIWHCDVDDCSGKPDGGDWTLAVKRGRDGKDYRAAA